MPVIENLFAFVVEEAPGDEGVVGFRAPDGEWLPLIGADLARVERLKPMAQQIATVVGKPVHLFYFKDRHHVETIMPKK